MQRRGAGGWMGYGVAVAYELRGVYRMNEELERQAFEEVMRKHGFNDLLVEYGNYVNFTIQTAWVVWQRARAKQENNDE